MIRTVRINDERFEKIARQIVKAVVAQGFVKPKVPESQVVQRLVRIFVDNMLEEQKIEEEAERMVEKLGRQAQGMDQRRIMLGIKERIAKEKGFSL
jgi:hypothetical protein